DDAYLLSDNILRALSYTQQDTTQPIFTLKIRALQPVQLSQVLQLNSHPLHPEAYLPSKSGKLERRPIVCQFSEIGALACTVTPNPFRDWVDFNVVVEAPGTALIELFTLDGKRVYSEYSALEEGSQTVRVHAGKLPTDKVFLYRFSMNHALFAGKIVRG
ncbi:MAG: hypothetical protein RIQ78_820, partial [Bacteroidota bacterium]